MNKTSKKTLPPDLEKRLLALGVTKGISDKFIYKRKKELIKA